MASCLGHNMSLKGIYGHPRKLVTDATHRLCNAIKADNSENPTKFVLMNTAGNSNRDLDEPISFGERLVKGLLRLLLPPQVDNERATNYLRTRIGQNDEAIEWVVVRPDNLIDEDESTEYDVFSSPIRSAIFDAGLTSRINLAHFMARLITEDDTWNKWKGQMPVIYNQISSLRPRRADGEWNFADGWIGEFETQRLPMNVVSWAAKKMGKSCERAY